MILLNINKIKKGMNKRIIKKSSIGLHFISCRFDILIGRNAKENDELLRKWEKENDYWLHTRDYPGCLRFY
ncbi:hypothetical protein BmIO_00343 [Borrelia miyamotoi]|nr:hypothetical protein BmIO_00343 [Borrelia miyamotoi]